MKRCRYYIFSDIGFDGQMTDVHRTNQRGRFLVTQLVYVEMYLYFLSCYDYYLCIIIVIMKHRLFSRSDLLGSETIGSMVTVY